MISEQLKGKAFKTLIIIGFCVSVLSVLEPHIQWISALCGVLGDGCRETGQYVIMGIHISVWGVLFYLVVFLAALFAQSFVFWLMMCGVGVEATLVRIMIEQEFFCVLCFLNLLIIILASGFIIQKKRVWEAMALSLLLFVISGALLFNDDVNTKIPCPQTNDNAVAASIGSQTIMDSELEVADAGKIYKYKKRIYALKRNQLDDRIEKFIISHEAQKKGISPQKLLTQIYAKAPQISDIEIQNHYRKYKDYYHGNNQTLPEAKRDIQRYLQKKQYAETMNRYLAPLKQQYDLIDYFLPPEHPIAKVDINNNPFIGPEDAKVTIVEFSDYMCPSCRQAHKLTTKIKKEYKGKIKWVFKDYPLERHNGAKQMAMAARCAGEQGKFWEYQDFMFEHTGRLDIIQLIGYAQRLGLDTDRFANCLRHKKYLTAVEKDIKDAKRAGVSSTPTFIINGKLNPGAPSLEAFREMIDEAL